MPLQIKLSYQYWKSNLKTLFSSASYVVVRMAMLFCRSGGRSTFGSWLKYLTHWTDARGLTSMTASCILQHHHEVERCSLNNCWIGYISRQSRPWKASVILSVLPTFVTFMPKKQCVSPAAEQGSSHSWVAVIMWSNSEQNISTHRFSTHFIWTQHYSGYLYWKQSAACFQYKFACSPRAHLGSLRVLWAVSHNPEVNRLPLIVNRCDSEREWLFVPIYQTSNELTPYPECTPPSLDVSWDQLQLPPWP